MEKIFRTEFAQSVFTNKYAHENAQSWTELSNTLVEDVCRDFITNDEKTDLKKLHSEMKFIAGGRYLYYAGRSNKFFNNCYLLRSEEDSREDWANLSWKAENCLMTGGGIGNDYSIYRPEGALISRTGGFASGPISKMSMINEIGKFVMQGASRRSAIYASLNWQHQDAGKFLIVKDWGEKLAPGTNLTYKQLKEKDFNASAPLDITNISLNYDNNFLSEISNDDLQTTFYKYLEKNTVLNLKNQLPETFIQNVYFAMKNGEPGFSFNFFDKEKETLRNACQPAFAKVLTPEGVKRFDEVDIGSKIWSCEGWTTIIKKWSTGIKKVYEVSFSDYYASKFIGTLNHELVTGFDWENSSFIKTQLQDVILDKLPVYTFSSSSSYILKENDCLTSTLTQENQIRDYKLLGEYEVFDITVDNSTHTYWTEGVNVSNCCEVSSEDDSDVCNLGSLNMANYETIEEWKAGVILATKFLLCGTLVAHLPYQKVYETREKNRRLGLGLMGVHEWLLKRGYKYEVVPELHEWLQVYEDYSTLTAIQLADKLGISRPVATRSIAPTGSIGILAGTTTGIEPLYAVAYKRRYLKGSNQWHYQYVIDGTAKILINKYDLNPDEIETAVDLSNDIERRIKFQADIQDYVDMAISSTLNVPSWGSEKNNEDTVHDVARSLAKYSHRLRGFTCYPDGARGGQPLTSVSYSEALKHEGAEYMEEFNDICTIAGKGGTCGN